MVEVKIDCKELKPLENVLRSMASRSLQLRPVMKQLGTCMLNIVDRNFESEGRPTKWKKRSPLGQANLATRAQANAQGTKRYNKAKSRGKASIMRRESMKAMSNKILSQSGDLKKSIVFEAEDSRVIVGPSGGIEYARVHQLGGVIRPKTKKALFVPCGKRFLRLKSVTIPARPYLIVPPSDAPKLARVAIVGLEKQIQARLVKGR